MWGIELAKLDIVAGNRGECVVDESVRAKARHECAAGQKESLTACILSRQTEKGGLFSVRDALATVLTSKAASTGACLDFQRATRNGSVRNEHSQRHK
jgi:hypothetical protein